MKTVLVTLPVLAIILTARAADPSPSSFSPTIANSSTPPGPPPAGGLDSRWRIFEGADGLSEGASHCSPGTVSDCGPIHRVYVDGFWMDSTEVTNAQFAKFVEATG